MHLENQIMAKLKEAMKAKDTTALEALRAIKSAILLEKTKSNAGELTETDALKLLQKLIKQRRDSATIYQQQNRSDLAKTELDQIAVIEQFLPQQMTPEEIEQEVAIIIKNLGAKSMKDMGKVIGVASNQMAGRADAKTISALVREKLS
jgi:uncharacterized protein YqeY